MTLEAERARAALRPDRGACRSSEVEQIYLPMSRLLNLYVAAAQQLHSVSRRSSSAARTARCPSSSASAARWRSARARRPACCKALLARWPDHPRVDLITTDGFLLPTPSSSVGGLMDRKGFPESFDTARLLQLSRRREVGRDARRGAGLFALPLRHSAEPRRSSSSTPIF